MFLIQARSSPISWLMSLQRIVQRVVLLDQALKLSLPRRKTALPAQLSRVASEDPSPPKRVARPKQGWPHGRFEGDSLAAGASSSSRCCIPRSQTRSITDERATVRTCVKRDQHRGSGSKPSRRLPPHAGEGQQADRSKRRSNKAVPDGDIQIASRFRFTPWSPQFVQTLLRRFLALIARAGTNRRQSCQPSSQREQDLNLRHLAAAIRPAQSWL